MIRLTAEQIASKPWHARNRYLEALRAERIANAGPRHEDVVKPHRNRPGSTPVDDIRADLMAIYVAHNHDIETTAAAIDVSYSVISSVLREKQNWVKSDTAKKIRKAAKETAKAQGEQEDMA